MRATIVKEYTFEAAHQLPHHNGKCARPHGHSYRVQVAVSGPIEQATKRSSEGMVMDFAELDDIMKPLLTEKLDHYNLSDSNQPGVTLVVATAENIAWFIAGEVFNALSRSGRADFSSVRLWETEKGSVIVTAQDLRTSGYVVQEETSNA